jgi:hypothetical protein
MSQHYINSNITFLHTYETHSIDERKIHFNKTSGQNYRGLCPITSIVPSTQISMHLNLATSQTNYLKTQQNKQVAFITFMIENQN